MVATGSAVLDGQLVGEVYQSERQTQAPVVGLDGYKQLQNARAQGAQLVIGEQLPGYLKAAKDIGFSLKPVMEQVSVQSGARGDSAKVNLDDPLDLSRQGQLVFDSDLLTSFGLGGLSIAASEQVLVNAALNMADGGEVTLYGPKLQVNADITAHGGQVRMGDVLQMRDQDALKDIPWTPRRDPRPGAGGRRRAPGCQRCAQRRTRQRGTGLAQRRQRVAAQQR